jgi:ABC-type nickel/cobalt efflux system permease component RcnA
MGGGLALALGSTAALNWGFLRQHGAASSLPRLTVRRPLRSLRLLFSDLRWVVGFVVGLAGWALYVVALRLAPLSLVQAVSAGGVGLLAVLVSLLLGASHAALPGHGKTVMAAYLVGLRGSLRQALGIGLTVTATHTAGVLLLGVALSASRTLAPERVYPWLGLASGLLLVAVGVALLGRALRGGHPHPHDHPHRQIPAHPQLHGPAAATRWWRWASPTGWCPARRRWWCWSAPARSGGCGSGCCWSPPTGPAWPRPSPAPGCCWPARGGCSTGARLAAATAAWHGSAGRCRSPPLH